MVVGCTIMFHILVQTEKLSDCCLRYLYRRYLISPVVMIILLSDFSQSLDTKYIFSL